MIARFTGGEAGVLSGLMRNPDQIRNRPMVVDAPSGKGRVIMFANNPIYRWQTFGEHAMVFNALMFWNDMAGAAYRDGEASDQIDRAVGALARQLFFSEALLPHFVDGLFHHFRRRPSGRPSDSRFR